jgi:broad specificity phosphatase PhoE
VQELKESNVPLENVHICYSPFSRTTHTAKVVASMLNLPYPCIFADSLLVFFFFLSYLVETIDIIMYFPTAACGFLSYAQSDCSKFWFYWLYFC